MDLVTAHTSKIFYRIGSTCFSDWRKFQIHPKPLQLNDDMQCIQLLLQNERPTGKQNFYQSDDKNFRIIENCNSTTQNISVVNRWWSETTWFESGQSLTHFLCLGLFRAIIGCIFTITQNYLHKSEASLRKHLREYDKKQLYKGQQN